jgi:adenylate cyclase class 2
LSISLSSKREDFKMRIEAHPRIKHKMIELKVRVNNHESLRKKLSSLKAQYIGISRQRDIYFKVPMGRLKLREVEDDRVAELIYYERENIKGPKSDDAFILRIRKAKDLKKILKKILAPLVVVEKIREIYQLQGTQIHLDTVKQLGKFVEFERPTSDDPEDAAKDRYILEEMMDQLKVDPNNLESLSYSDLSQA